MVNISPHAGDSASLIERGLAARVRDALDDTPVVMIVGPRQAGKTTFCQMVSEDRPAKFLTLDELGTLAAVRSDPDAFIASQRGLLVIDEIQKAPELLPAIKLAVDRRRLPGRFLLTGSANVLTLPRVSESLAGRMEVLTMWTLSQGEIGGRLDESFVDALFNEGPVEDIRSFDTKEDVIIRALGGGYPEIQQRTRADRREAWFESYLTTIVQRDIRDLANIENVAVIPRVLASLASRAGGVLNIADHSRALGLAYTTLTRYVSLLETTFIVKLIPAWASGRRVRTLKAPRVFIADTGLLAHLIGLDEERIGRDPTATGPLLENLVAMEIVKQLAWSRTRAALHHFRTYAGHEVDFVLEAPDGRVVAVEVKAGKVGEGDFKGLRAFADLAGDRFVRGIVLGTGHDVLPFGEKLAAVPISALWI